MEKPFYGVYYYKQSFVGANVKLVGYYKTIDEAIKRLAEFIPVFKRGINNTVHGNGRVGWVNQYTFGDFDSEYNASQPHNPIDIYYINLCL